MKKWISFLFAELKKGMKLIPFFSISAAVSAAAVLLAAFLFCTFSNESTILPKARIGIVVTDQQFVLSDSDDSDTASEETLTDASPGLMTGLAVQLAGSMESVNALGELSLMKAAEAEAALADGSADLAVYLSPETYDDINTGINTPVSIRMSEAAASLKQNLFASLLSSAVRMLRSVEAVVYSPASIEEQYPLVSDAATVGDDLFKTCLKMILGRTSLWNEVSVSAYGSLSMLQFYLTTGIVLLLFLFGLGFSSFYTDSGNTVLRMLARTGVGRIPLSFAVYLAVCTAWLAFESILVFLVQLVSGAYTQVNAAEARSFPIIAQAAASALLPALTGTLRMIPAMLCIALLLAALQHLTGVFLPSQTRGLFWLLLTVCLFVIGGGILPTAYLPPVLRSAAEHLSPVILCQRLLAPGLFPEQASAAALSVYITALLMACVLLLPALLQHARNRDERSMMLSSGKADEKKQPASAAADQSVPLESPAFSNVKHRASGFRSLRLRFRLLLRRQLRRPSFFLVSVLALCFQLFLVSIALPYADNTGIGLYCADSSRAEVVTDMLLTSPSCYRYTAYSSREMLEQDVASGKLDAGFVLDERLDAFAETGSMEGNIDVIYSSFSTKYAPAEEEVFAAVLDVTMPDTVHRLAADGRIFAETSDEAEAALLDVSKRYLESDALFSLRYENPAAGEVLDADELAELYNVNTAMTDLVKNTSGITSGTAALVEIILFAAALFFSAARFSDTERNFAQALRSRIRFLWYFSEALLPQLLFGTALLAVMYCSGPLRSLSFLQLFLVWCIGVPLTALWSACFASLFHREQLYLFAAASVLLLGAAFAMSTDSAVLHILTRRIGWLRVLFPTAWTSFVL